MRVAPSSLVGLIALCSIAQFAQAQPRSLTRAEALSAVAAGQDRALQPYLLHHAATTDGDVTPVIVGAVFTPFLRVALASRKADESHASASVDDLQSRFGRSVIYVAMRWYCCDGPNPAQFNPFEHFDFKIGLRQRGDRRTSLQPPLEVFRGADVLDEFGATLPYDDVVLVAVYPLASLRTGTEFIISRSTNGATFTRIGKVTADDYARWR